MVTCKAAGFSEITSAACLRARLALCSPSAAITLLWSCDNYFCHLRHHYLSSYAVCQRATCFMFSFCSDHLVAILKSFHHRSSSFNHPVSRHIMLCAHPLQRSPCDDLVIIIFATTTILIMTTFALAFLAASASAAMALISCSGTLTSFTCLLKCMCVLSDFLKYIRFFASLLHYNRHHLMWSAIISSL